MFCFFFLTNELKNETSDVEEQTEKSRRLRDQLWSREYILFCGAWIVTVVNMTTILSAIDHILLRNGDVDGRVSSLFSNSLSLSFVGCVVFGNILSLIGT